MDTYSLLRGFADSWFLIIMFAFFIGACVWAMWPGLRKERAEAASIPFRDEQPAPLNPETQRKSNNAFSKGQSND